MGGELPFRLKVTGRDAIDGIRAISTSFRFQGSLRLEGSSLRIGWSGVARIQDVEIGSVRDDHLPLPAETLLVPVARLRGAELRGGWWRPRLTVSGRDLRALALVPSEELATVHFWYARADRLVAAALAADLTRAIAAAEQAETGETEIIHLSDSTPVTPPTI